MVPVAMESWCLASSSLRLDIGAVECRRVIEYDCLCDTEPSTAAFAITRTYQLRPEDDDDDSDDDDDGDDDDDNDNSV